MTVGSSTQVVEQRSPGRQGTKQSRKLVKKTSIPNSSSLPDLTDLERDFTDPLASEFTKPLKPKTVKPRQPNPAIKVRNSFEPLGVDSDADDLRMSLESVNSTPLDTPSG